jgi:hypothetical protein
MVPWGQYGVVMMDPIRRYQDKAMLQYWTQRDHQVGHDIIYQGSSTYMMYTVGQLRYSSPRQRALKVKLMLDWGVHGRRMQLMGLDKSGRCPICMETDSLDHLGFECHYSAANHRRQECVAGTESAINRLTKESQKRPRWLGRHGKFFSGSSKRCTCDTHLSFCYGGAYCRNSCENI